MAEEIAQLLKQQNQIFAYWAERVGNFQITIPNPASPAHLTSQSVPLPPPLCLEGDMEENYTFFESNWKNYAVAVGMNDWPESENKKKVSFLLSVVGTDALKRYFNFELNEQQKASPEAVLDAIKAKVVPVRNIIVDRLEFFSAIQIPTETIDEYVSRLKLLGKPCRFGALEQDMMVFKIVTSNKWPNLKAKMLTMPDVNLPKAIDLCRMEEITARHSKQLSLEPSMDVNKVTDQVCKFCGGRHPFKRGACPAFGKRCDKCGGKNHFQRVCKSSGSSGNLKPGRRVNIVRRYQDVFEGYGKMEGPVTLEIDQEVKPVIQTPRRIPIAFREDLRRKINQLAQDGIIQKESQHTEWKHRNSKTLRGTGPW
ncbi:uncharacterized protein LOC134288430 [Aedes albopictus]|uniref:Uncharacterized protein n=1 Tax=Aedes albopictus TaxID=7160 RepID=A0ABM1YSG2_AEDAL